MSPQEWIAHSPGLNPLDYSVWDIWQELVYEGRREPFANLKDLHNVINVKNLNSLKLGVRTTW